MFSTTRNIIRNTNLLKLDSFKVEKVALIHVCATRHWNILSKKLPPCYKVSNNLLRLSHVRNLSSSTVVNNQEDTITVYSPGKQVSSTTAPVVDKASSSVSDVTSNTATSSASAVTENVANIAATPLPPIPVPPKPPVVPELLGEPPFSSIGLGGWSPVGLLQNAFEYLHINLDMPWWQCIVLGTVVVRLLMTPLVVISQRNAIIMANNSPQMKKIQTKLSDAKSRGDIMEAAQYSQELFVFMKEKNLNPIKNMLVPLAQAPVFLSFFMGLREMANLPVKSLHEGGLFWFTDLTVPDQYYVMPILTCVTLLATIEIGSEGKITGPNQHLMKIFLRGIPVVLFPFIMNFPGVLHLYWLSTNVFSLIQTGTIKYVPSVRRICKIPEQKKVEQLNVEKKPVIAAVKDWWKDTRNTSKIQNRTRNDQSTFLSAGRSGIKKTYKYNPTTPHQQPTTFHAKKI
ncbi:hypothetical protein LSTR_LSTR011051 [Laodelphax striatellus]|uniref:Membrane insertase YidC/Oxa/ALB C-terminal domain-containing protein n=1 Tax=Laodelphax striatellus TaxID=195883 RepID=A0A482WGI5_LAOST|nr:hypothetical protein LSTR_LSTR011051 [Laodelphax striatellus]